MQSANKLLAGIGWEEDNFTVPLTADESSSISHFGLRASIRPAFSEVLAEHLAPLTALAQSLVIDLREETDRHGHFADVIDAEGLRVIRLEVA